MFKTLISTDVLAARLVDPLWVVVDCRFKLDDRECRRRGGGPGLNIAQMKRERRRRDERRERHGRYDTI